MRRLRETQAAVPKRRETPRDRPGRAGLRLCYKWLGYDSRRERGIDDLRYAVPKLDQGGQISTHLGVCVRAALDSGLPREREAFFFSSGC